MSDFPDFKLSLEIRIDWSDLDMYEHVNNVSYMRFLQSGRVNFWEATGIHNFYRNSNQGTMLVSTKCEFKKSLHYPGKAIVKTKPDFIGNTSFGLKHLVLNEKNETVPKINKWRSLWLSHQRLSGAKIPFIMIQHPA